jgi:hypothetical protein
VIVVDTNVLAYLLIPGRFTERAEHWLQADPRWAAPRLWRSELGNVLATYVRAGSLPLADAVTLHRRAGLIIGPDEYEVEMSDVLRLSSGSGCSAYQTSTSTASPCSSISSRRRGLALAHQLGQRQLRWRQSRAPSSPAAGGACRG